MNWKIYFIVILVTVLGSVGFTCPCGMAKASQVIEHIAGEPDIEEVESTENVYHSVHEVKKTIITDNRTKEIYIETPKGIVRIKKKVGEGTKIVRVTTGKTNKTIITKDDEKEVYIVTPKSVIQIIKDLKNNTKEIYITSPKMKIEIKKKFGEEEFNDVEELLSESEDIEEIEIDPVKERIRMRIRYGNIINETELPEHTMSMIQARVKHKPVNITIGREDKEIKIHFGNLTVTSKANVKIEDGIVKIKLKNKTKEINITPDEVLRKIRNATRFHKVEKVEIEAEGEKVMYKFKVVRRAKLFGFFDIELPVETKIDIETGGMSGINMPWWAFLAKLE